MGSVEGTPSMMLYQPDARSPHKSREEVLIHQILVRREDRFQELIQPHMGVLSRVVMNRMRNDSAAEDVVQKTLLKAFARLEQFRFKASFRTWLIQIALNEVLQWHRTRMHGRFFTLEEIVVPQMQVADELASPLKQCER